jgi:uncharacterized protein (TIGR02246 family)
MSEHAVRKTISTYFAAASMLDSKALAELFSKQAECEDPVGTPLQRGREAIEAGFAAFAAQLTEFSLEPARVFVRGDSVAVQWNGQGQGKNNRQVMFIGISVFTLDPQARITRLNSYWDPTPVQAELQRAAPEKSS